MRQDSEPIPLVDLAWQHRSLARELEPRLTTIIRQGDFILGKAVQEFEHHFAQACRVNYGIGVASGTAAIALGLQACGLGSGDEVLVPVNTFIATVLGVLQAGGVPILVDCEAKTALIDLEKASQKVTSRTKAIVPVHLYGQMVSPRQLQDFAQSYNLFIFEDAAQAHLAQREGKRAGSLGKAAAFSFYPSKNLGAMGNGGMIVTDDPEIAEQVRRLRNYGASSKYHHVELGTNSRLDSLQAAVLGVKLNYLEQWNYLRYLEAQSYDRALSQWSEIQSLQNDCGPGHVYHLYVITLKQHSPDDRRQLQYSLAQAGIETGIHYPIPCHLQPCCQFLGHQIGDFPVAEQLANKILSLPIFPGIQVTHIKRVVTGLIQELETL